MTEALLSHGYTSNFYSQGELFAWYGAVKQLCVVVPLRQQNSSKIPSTISQKRGALLVLSADAKELTTSVWVQGVVVVQEPQTRNQNLYKLGNIYKVY